MASEYISTKPRDAFRGNITFHKHALDVFPSAELRDAPIWQIVESVAGELRVVGEKAQVPYFVTSRYRDDLPFTERTRSKALARGLGTHGKQRSRAHCTGSSILIFEFDGVTREQFELVKASLEASGLEFLMFSSYSHGSPEKPGYRFRVLLFVDVVQDHAEHEAAHDALGVELFAGVPYDPSCKRMYQQQGGWASHPDWQGEAFKHYGQGGLVDGAKAAQAGRLLHPEKPKAAAYVAPKLSVTAQTQRLEEALAWLNADETHVWHCLMVAWKAAAGVIGEDAARDFAVRYSTQGSEAARRGNDDPRYNPAEFFDRAAPSMTAEVGMATILANAKENAFACLRQGLGTGERLTDKQLRAAWYCARYHGKAYRDLMAEYGVEVAA